MEIIKMNHELAIKNMDELKLLYYQNAHECSFVKSFNLEDAEIKIRDLSEHLKNQSAICYGLFDKEKLVGYVWAYQHSFRDELRVYINEIRIFEDYRGKGFGEKLIACVEKEAIAIGIKAIYLHAEATNQGAIRLYNRLGYTPERIQLRKCLVEEDYEN